MKGTPAGAHLETILVVDDTPANLKLLATLLQQNGFKVRMALSGALALSSIEKSPPDLVLLDARMPQMDGYAVCRRLKSMERIRDIPVIFISGLQDTEDKLKAFDAGGVDYITKPFQISEVMVRVNTQLMQKRLQRELMEQNQRLDEMVRLRTRELSAANERLALLNRTKTDFLSLIAHELRTPLNGLMGAADLAFDSQRTGQPEAELHALYEDSRRRIMRLLDDAKLLGEVELSGQGRVGGTVSLDEVMGAVQGSLHELVPAPGKRVTLPADGLGLVCGESLSLQKALRCLWETCLKCYTEEEDGVVAVSALPRLEDVVLTFTTRKHRLAEPDLVHLFEVLAVSKPFPGGDLGLGPALAMRIITLLGGRVETKNREPAGLEITVWLPRLTARGE